MSADTCSRLASVRIVSGPSVISHASFCCRTSAATGTSVALSGMPLLPDEFKCGDQGITLIHVQMPQRVAHFIDQTVSKSSKEFPDNLVVFHTLHPVLIIKFLDLVTQSGLHELRLNLGIQMLWTARLKNTTLAGLCHRALD